MGFVANYLALQQPVSQVAAVDLLAEVFTLQQPAVAQQAASQLHSLVTAQVQSQDAQTQTVHPQLELFFSGAAL